MSLSSRRETIIVSIVVASAVLVAGIAGTMIIRKKQQKTGESYATPIDASLEQSMGKAPAFTLENMDGKKISNTDLLGKVWVVDFIFTTCGGTCPMMTESMKVVQDRVKDLADVRFVSITVDPKNDTPQALREYAQHWGADPERWYFLRGEREEIARIDREGFHLGNPDDVVDHSQRLVLIDPLGKIRGYYDGATPHRGTHAQTLAEDIRKILVHQRP